MIEKHNELKFKKAIKFLDEIGITVLFKNLEVETFLPGLKIENGNIILDKEKLKYPGDILHEAGHLAVIPSVERTSVSEASIGFREMREAEEMMAIAWCYAACVHLEIDCRFVFHEDGYKGGGNNMAENFEQGRYFGVPMLQWTGMTLEKKNEKNNPIYPVMIKWLRD